METCLFTKYPAYMHKEKCSCKSQIAFYFVNNYLKPLLLPIDLKELFERSGTDPASQGMSYQVLRKFFDTATPDPHSLERYDKDGDQRFSLAEMKAAAGL